MAKEVPSQFKYNSRSLLKIKNAGKKEIPTRKVTEKVIINAAIVHVKQEKNINLSKIQQGLIKITKTTQNR